MIVISYLSEVVLRHLPLNLPSAVCDKHTLVLINIMRTEKNHDHDHDDDNHDHDDDQSEDCSVTGLGSSITPFPLFITNTDLQLAAAITRQEHNWIFTI